MSPDVHRPTAAPWQYDAYGLRLLTSRPLPHLCPVATTAPPDCFIDLAGPGVEAPEAPPAWTRTHAVDNPFGQSFERWVAPDDDGPRVRLRYAQPPEEVVFDVAPRGRRLHVTWSETVTLEEVTTLLLGAVLGQVLYLREVTCLHANAVAVDGRALLLVGHSGAGKSSTTALLARRGCPVVTDDIAALVQREDGIYVMPGLPRLRLRPDVAARYWPTTPLDPVWQGRETFPEKRYLPLTESALPVVRRPLPVAAVYLLGARDAERPAAALTPLSAADSLLALLPHAYAQWALGPDENARTFALLGRLGATVPVRRLDRREGLDALPAVCDLLLDDMAPLLA